ncbi:Sugar phosphate isomerase/epimerase [Dethiosulfatibacter aminovorans DSM 17477]|uniref:Sugar phosphate isomerase/epimerase n=1 Tax=Dethiosulfatibacter aminovorans DSM 17477 TaxID=1121476 RepID=A0A1M6AJA0_9FIRM|nr:sugar phosphate isomerase/epimerase [Dethiosulfatibacter aminovorans]SHI36511.1 Sugar phosphate isomerase/epimerase [Dethiosulfatibacter aminovorans DSM 17477]
MKTEFSLAHLTVLGCAPPEMIYIASLCGYDYVSIRPIYMKLPNEPNYDLAHNKAMMKHTKEAMRRTGMRIHDIELAKIDDTIDVEDYKAAIETGAELGAKSLLSSIWTEDKSMYIEKFHHLCELAKPYGMTVDLEFVTWAGVKNLKQAVEVLNSIDIDNKGLMIDTLHFNRSRVALEELDNLPPEWFNYVHLCDGPKEIPETKEGLIHTGRDERLYCGEGEINIADIIRRIPRPVVYSLELPHLKRVKELGYTEHARRCLVTAKEYLEKHNLENFCLK